jgi:hypothetical protein
MNPPEPDKSLARLLAGWRVAPARNPNFRQAVWTRIGARDGTARWTGYLRAHAALVAGAFALALIAGAWSGRERAQARAAADRSKLVTNYVQALDARTMRGP